MNCAEAIDEILGERHDWRMVRMEFPRNNPSPRVVGSFGDGDSLARATPESLRDECDLAEIRLDLIAEEFHERGPAMWEHLRGFPLLFTARCHPEGSPIDLPLASRISLLRAAIPDASLIDIEAKSVAEMADLIVEINAQRLPWVSSFHNFQGLPSSEELEKYVAVSRAAGASVFKVAAHLATPRDVAELGEFQQSDQGISLSTMGMGKLAPVSRLLCAQLGSVLNYGYLGKSATAPGQWSARELRNSIRLMQPFSIQ